MSDKAATEKATQFLQKFESALSNQDISAATALFDDECYWRDLVSFTWNIKTVEGRDQVQNMLESQLSTIKPHNWILNTDEQVSEADGVLEAWFNFETALGRGYGLVRLRDGLVWTLLTTLLELKGYEEPVFGNRPMGAKHGTQKNISTWKEKSEKEGIEN